MGANDYPMIREAYVGWAEISVGIDIAEGDSISTKDFSAVDWSQKLEPGDVPGAGPNLLGRTTGMYGCDGTFTMYRAAYHKLVKSLAQKSERYGTVVFDVTVSWSPLEADNATSDNVFTVKLIGCRIKEEQASNAPGSDAAAVVVPLSLSRVVNVVDGRELSLV